MGEVVLGLVFMQLTMSVIVLMRSMPIRLKGWGVWVVARSTFIMDVVSL